MVGIGYSGRRANQPREKYPVCQVHSLDNWFLYGPTMEQAIQDKPTFWAQVTVLGLTNPGAGHKINWCEARLIKNASHLVTPI